MKSSPVFLICQWKWTIFLHSISYVLFSSSMSQNVRLLNSLSTPDSAPSLLGVSRFCFFLPFLSTWRKPLYQNCWFPQCPSSSLLFDYFAFFHDTSHFSSIHKAFNHIRASANSHLYAILLIHSTTFMTCAPLHLQSCPKHSFGQNPIFIQSVDGLYLSDGTILLFRFEIFQPTPFLPPSFAMRWNKACTAFPCNA